METIGIKLEEKRITKQKCDMIVKLEINAVRASTSCIFPGAKAKLTELPTKKKQVKLGSHQMAKQIFNSEVNLVSDWVVEHKPKKPRKKTLYKKYHKICVSRRFNISQIEGGVTMEPLDGAKFVYLSDYSVVELVHPT
jgi:hypothetical protein